MTATLESTQSKPTSGAAATLPAAAHFAAVGIEKTYRKGAHRVPVLKGVHLSIARGELLSIVGQSGSGKSTLMHMMGLLDVPDVGEVYFDGQRVDDLPPRTRDELRNRVFGFIFQFYHLLPELTLLENVLAPQMIRHSAWNFWKQRRQLRDEARAIIDRVGLSHRLKHRPSELSGGEMQRAAIARALVARPKILLADEPTGNLDRDTGHEIIELLRGLNENDDLTIVMVTHDEDVAAMGHRLVRLTEGRTEVIRAAA